MRNPSASKFGDKAIPDYSLFPVTKKADDPIDHIRIDIEWNTVKSLAEVEGENAYEVCYYVQPF